MTAPSPDAPLKIGTRASPLALAQAHETRARLMKAHDLPEAAFEIVAMTTSGDLALEKKLGEIGGKGLFTKEIEQALIDGGVDIAVHSMKDMPTTLPDGLIFGAYLPREDVRDAFLSPHAPSLADLPAGSIIGTASLRRQAQVLRLRPDLTTRLFRGSVQTRMRKLGDGEADATFLAMAGLTRLGLSDVARGAVPVTEMLPAVAQGAIGIELRDGDDATATLLAAIDDTPTGVQLACERAFLGALDGSCRTPIGGYAELTGDRIIFHGEVLRPDGSEHHATRREGAISDATEMGEDAGLELKKRAGPNFFVSA